MNPKIPNSWISTGFLNAFDIQGGTQPPKSEFIYEAKPGYVQLLQIRDFGERTVPTFIPDTKKLKKCSERDLLIARYGASLGRILTGMSGAYNVAMAKVSVPEQFNRRYAYYLLRSESFQAPLRMVSRSAQNGFNKEDLAGFQVPIAPALEQKRIADKLDTVLTCVDAVNTRLASVAPILKRFRQSVLAAATSGRLTEDWREANPAFNAKEWLDGVANTRERLSRKSPIEPSLSDLPGDVELPKTWAVAGLDALAAKRPHALKAGPFGSALKKSMYVAQGYKIYGQEQVIAGDETVGDYFISDEKFAELRACAVEPGDILISLVGTIGRVLVLSADALPGIINPRLVKLSLNPEVNRSYFSFYLRSPVALSFFEGNSHGGTMDILNLGILRNLPILMPPPEEQAEIVSRVETLFAFADRLEARLLTAKTATERLTPALLAKAFRGELVPQDPSDEPASALLQRLVANTEAPAAQRGRRKATAAKV